MNQQLLEAPTIGRGKAPEWTKEEEAGLLDAVLEAKSSGTPLQPIFDEFASRRGVQPGAISAKWYKLDPNKKPSKKHKKAPAASNPVPRRTDSVYELAVLEGMILAVAPAAHSRLKPQLDRVRSGL